MSKYVKIIGVVGGVLSGIYAYLNGDAAQGVGLVLASLGSSTAFGK